MTPEHTATNLTVHVLNTQRLMFKNYCYIVEHLGTKEAVLIDPSWEFHTVDQTLNQSGATPTAILLTHHHPDHVHLAQDCAKAYDIPVYMSNNEIDYYGFRCHNLQPLPDDKQFSIGAMTITLVQTPGHTHGGVCYLFDDQSFFTGDTLFNEGCGICTGKGADPTKMFDSLQIIKKIINDNTIIYPGHQFHSSIGQTFAFVKEHNIYLQLTTIDSFVNFRMRKQNMKNWLNFK